MAIQRHGRYIVTANDTQDGSAHNEYAEAVEHAVRIKQLNPIVDVRIIPPNNWEVTYFDTAGDVIQPTPTPIPEPVPTPIPEPTPTPVPVPVDLTLFDQNLLGFAETWSRNWNFEGHDCIPNVPRTFDGTTVTFDGNYGFWEINETTYEPWLFDRTSVAYDLYKLTGQQRWLDLFHTYFAFYSSRIGSDGVFTPKGYGDTKYSYVKPFYIYEQLTGDTQYRPVAMRIYNAWVSDFPSNYSRSQYMWTEREIAFALESAVYWHKLSGDVSALERATALVNQWDIVCDGHGAPLHTLSQHQEEFDNAYAIMMMTSPWMAGLYFQAAKAYDEVTGGDRGYQQARRYCEWLNQYGLFNLVTSPEYSGSLAPYYLVGEGIFYDREGTSEDAYEHSYDVANIYVFAGMTPSPQHASLMDAANRCLAYWTRSFPYLPKYRCTPPRKFNWWMRSRDLT